MFGCGAKLRAIEVDRPYEIGVLPCLEGVAERFGLVLTVLCLISDLDVVGVAHVVGGVVDATGHVAVYAG